MRLLSIDCVDFSLKSRWRSASFLCLAALVTLAGSAEAIKIAAVTALGKSTEVADVQKGLALDPDNPALHDRLSQLYGNSLGVEKLAAGVAEARRATALNPHKFDYWLSLASACESVRDNLCADQGLQRALALSPMTPVVWWVAGNHYVRTDRPEVALPCFRRLLELGPDYATPTFSLTLRAYGDPKMILESVVGGGKDPKLALAFADYTSGRDDFEAAHQAWAQTVGRGSWFAFAAVRPYLERLLSHGRYQEAQAVWMYLEQRGVIAKPAGSEENNLVFNGGFEESPLDAGFDWRSPSSPYVSVDFADSSAYQGAHCLRVDFPVSQNDEFEPVYQIVPVAANQAYTLAAYVRSRDITSDSGPCLRVADVACPGCWNAATSTTVGTTPWHKITLEFSTGAETRAVRLSVWRPRSRTFPMEISGSFWVDVVSVRAEGGVGK